MDYNRNGTSNGVPRFEAQRGTSRQGKQKTPYSKKKNSGSAAGVMKDVILLPNPRMKLVPRGRIREDLYVRGFVTTAVNITNEMTASEIGACFADLFSNKLKGRPFNFVRAVGNKIVDVNLAQGITGKILKHICRQGLVYLRCARPTDTEFAWVEEEYSDDGINNVYDAESGSDDLPESGATQTMSTLVTAQSPNLVQVGDKQSNTLNTVPNTDIFQYFHTPSSSASHTMSTPVAFQSSDVVQVNETTSSQSSTPSSVPNPDILQYFPMPSSASNQSLASMLALHVIYNSQLGKLNTMLTNAVTDFLLRHLSMEHGYLMQSISQVKIY